MQCALLLLFLQTNKYKIMKFLEGVKKEVSAIWQIKSNRLIIKDSLLFVLATLVFHFLYWNANMNTWIFGPFTDEVFGFFTNLVYQLATPFIPYVTSKSFDCADTSYYFYTLSDDGVKYYHYIMTVVSDCSGVKQLLQWALVMILCRGKWYKKIVYYFAGAIVLLLANVVRIVFLTSLFVTHTSLFTPVHDWVTRPAMYVIIFAMWLLWLKLINKKDNKSNTEKAETTSLPTT